MVNLNASNELLTNAFDISKLEWILDKWISKDGESTSTEAWIKLNNNKLEGHSETVKNGDTLFSEKLKIVKEENDIFYIADVKHNPAPVKFKLTLLDDTTAVFENPNHDFPQKITYKNDNGNLLAWIEGPGKNGNWKKIDFYMAKAR